MLIDTFISLKSRILSAAQRAKTDFNAITLVAVTKTVPVETINEAINCGITDVGENKVQEAQKKFVSMVPGVKKHFIGHLQTNKAKKAVELFDIIESVDSFRLAQEIEKHASAAGKVQECFLEIKISQEESKFGLAPEDAAPLLEKLTGLTHIKVTGLMAMAPYFDNPQASRPFFKKAKVLFDSLKQKYPDIKHLSMGMSGDFEAAIEEGSNMVRIGTALFGERTYVK